ncbi:MAG: lipoprotein-releasing system ATP-binding protein LolD [Flavobacteriaceae bacterium]|nr:lipoprotein-releasing system ATP-binding protein LolD [Flavobacteriaceae bacterium]
MKFVLSARNLSKKYGTLNVLNSVDIKVAEKEIVAIVGPSGAGKTTLLHILGTLDRPENKPDVSLIVDGINTNELSEKELAKFRNQKIGFIFQFHELLPEFSALENVCIPAWISKSNLKNAEKMGKDLLQRLGIGDKTNNKPSSLSGGEQQRVAVARALINKPKIIFADEPSGNLDSNNANQLHDLFFELRDELGCSFIIVTHNKALAERADRIISLKDGNILT